MPRRWDRLVVTTNHTILIAEDEAGAVRESKRSLDGAAGEIRGYSDFG